MKERNIVTVAAFVQTQYFVPSWTLLPPWDDSGAERTRKPPRHIAICRAVGRGSFHAPILSQPLLKSWLGRTPSTFPFSLFTLLVHRCVPIAYRSVNCRDRHLCIQPTEQAGAALLPRFATTKDRNAAFAYPLADRPLRRIRYGRCTRKPMGKKPAAALHRRTGVCQRVVTYERAPDLPRLAHLRAWASDSSLRPLVVHKYAFGSQS